jgi:hypothetical protein
MNRQTIIQIVKGYENQLANAEIANDKNLINWLNAQINEGHRALGTMATGYNN